MKKEIMSGFDLFSLLFKAEVKEEKERKEVVKEITFFLSEVKSVYMTNNKHDYVFGFALLTCFEILEKNYSDELISFINELIWINGEEYDTVNQEFRLREDFSRNLPNDYLIEKNDELKNRSLRDAFKDMVLYGNFAVYEDGNYSI